MWPSPSHVRRMIGLSHEEGSEQNFTGGQRVCRGLIRHPKPLCTVTHFVRYGYITLGASNKPDPAQFHLIKVSFDLETELVFQKHRLDEASRACFYPKCRGLPACLRT